MINIASIYELAQDCDLVFSYSLISFSASLIVSRTKLLKLFSAPVLASLLISGQRAFWICDRVNMQLISLPTINVWANSLAVSGEIQLGFAGVANAKHFEQLTHVVVEAELEFISHGLIIGCGLEESRFFGEICLTGPSQQTS